MVAAGAQQIVFGPGQVSQPLERMGKKEGVLGAFRCELEAVSRQLGRLSPEFAKIERPALSSKWRLDLVG